MSAKMNGTAETVKVSLLSVRRPSTEPSPSGVLCPPCVNMDGCPALALGTRGMGQLPALVMGKPTAFQPRAVTHPLCSPAACLLDARGWELALSSHAQKSPHPGRSQRTGVFRTG